MSTVELKPRIQLVCHICGTKANAGVQLAQPHTTSTEESPKYTVEIIIHTCEEHVQQAKIIAKNLGGFLK